jgi:hypothetical protein
MMRITQMLVVAGFAAAICTAPEAGAIQSGSATVSGGLEFSREVRPFPRPPVIVNAVPKPPEKAAASSEVERIARAACPAGRSQGSDPACRESPRVPRPRPAS